MVRIIDDSGSVTKCLLDPYDRELSALESTAQRESWECELSIQLMGRCGLRADEVTSPTRSSLRWSSSGECWFLEVVGKNTSGGDKKTRDAWIPESVKENIQRYASEVDDDLVQASTSGGRGRRITWSSGGPTSEL